MGTSWFKQWLALKKQVAFLIPVLLLALAFAVVVGMQSGNGTDSTNAILVVRSGEKLHCFEIDTKAGKIIRSNSLNCSDLTVSSKTELEPSVWIEGDALMTNAPESQTPRAIARDKRFSDLGPKTVVLVWGQETKEESD